MVPNDVYNANPNLYEQAKKSMAQDQCITLFIRNRPVAIVGVTRYWQGVGEIWSLTSVLVNKYPVAFFKACNQRLNDFIEFNMMKRVQVTVNINFEKGQNFVRHLGFVPEGIMNHYGPEGDDHVLFARYS